MLKNRPAKAQPARIRARHQRADARSRGDLPLRGTRHLPADGRARGTRRRQEGPVRIRAQCPPGQPLPRRADGQRDQGADRPRPRAAGRAAAAITARSRRAGGCSSRPGGWPPACRIRCPATASTTHCSATRSRCSCELPGTRVTLVSKDINLRIKAAILGVHAEDYLQRPHDRGRRPAVHRRHRAARGLLGNAWQQCGVLAGAGPHLLPRPRPAGARVAAEPVPVRQRRRLLRGDRAHDRRRCRDARTDPGLPQRAPRRLGHHRAQPRAESRAEPAARPGNRLRHDPRPGGHRQDAADTGRRADADARDQSLQRDHHDARDDSARRGHRIPARAPKRRRWSPGWAR